MQRESTSPLMRKPVFVPTLLIGSFCLLPRLGGLLRRRSPKAGLRQLDRLEDHMLRDIGLTRADIRDMARLPADADLVAELKRRRDARLERSWDES